MEEFSSVATDGEMRHLTSDLIQEFLDNGLNSKEEALVREHLSVCPRCREETEGWSRLFTELGSLPDLVPGPSLSRQVLDRLPVREPVASGVRGWFGTRKSSEYGGGHLPGDTLQDQVEGLLSGRRAARARAHLAACDPCQEELKSWERVFRSLADLGRFAPAPGFAGRVMARVRIPAPLPAPWLSAGSRALGWSRGFLPKTRRGWAVAGGIASAPTITLTALFFLVFSHPLLTLGSFTTYASWKASALFSSLFSYLATAVVESVALFRAYSLLAAMAKSPLLVGVGGLVFSLLSALALWVLYRNLLATRSADRSYASVQV
jgi:anti-sigma factor RsiW